ncbi:PEP/pyruvate-binding domain-containing protein [Pseudonocardia saturnea]
MVAESVVWVDEVEPAQAVALAGSKMGRLTELHRAGVEVPRGFAVTVEAYRRHCTESGLDARIDEVIEWLGPDPADAAVEDASARIRALFEQTPMSDGLAAEITEAYEELSLRCVDVNVPTAVRSSATGEDAADASFAGIFDTYLGVAGASRVLDAVRQCWGSLFTGRALAYRLRKGISHHAMPIAVGVIELIHARASGVAFSVHPVTGKPDRIVIETSWGWGEAIVQGLVNPDHVEVGKADGRLLKYDVAHKTVVSAFDFAAGRVTEIEMPAKLADRRVLDDEQVAAVAAAVTSIEEHYGYPVDVEWVISRHRRAGDPVCIVQSRPVTVTAAESTAAAYDPVALAQKFVFSGKPIPGR